MILAKTTWFEFLSKLYAYNPIATILLIIYAVFLIIFLIAFIKGYNSLSGKGGWGWWDGPGVY